MDVFSHQPSTRLSLVVALLLLLHWGTLSASAEEDNMYGEGLQQQRCSCDPQRLSECRDYMEMRREQPSERCCEELERTSPQCRCRAIQQLLDQCQSYDSNQRRRREGRGREEEEELVQRAEELPNTRNVRQPPRRCDIQRCSHKSFHQFDQGY